MGGNFRDFLAGMCGAGEPLVDDLPSRSYATALAMVDAGKRERETLRAENQWLREAIADALADLTPGIAPYSVLDNALRRGAPSP